ncbi:MAG: CRISPR-associated protein Cas4 [Bacteroidales bacterium]|nr:CRISPR-associated protein Cas4 [Bacteroidales bacterium]
MKNLYNEDEFLLISGIQHFAFCSRQWALIHVEQLWAENVKTIEGQHLHNRVDDPFLKDSGNQIEVWRSVSLISYSLGLTGRGDVVEFKTGDSGIELPGKTGWWTPFPVEYKRGKPKPDERDEVQLCAQAICMEEMFETTIEEGAMFYGETRRRAIISFTKELRQQVVDYTEEMHRLFKLAITPPPVYKPHCKSCSLFDVCLPKSINRNRTVISYLKRELQ